MKTWKIHLIAVVILVIAELIGIKVLSFGTVKIVLLPMLFALVIGCFTGPKVLRLVNDEEMHKASPYAGYALMLLIAYYGTLIGPNLNQLWSSGAALVLQEIGNVGTVFVGLPIAIWLGLKREAVGGTFSVSREGGLAIVADLFGMDSPEGRGVMAVYIIGSLLGTIAFGLLASFGVYFLGYSPQALAMASGVGSASMMTGGVSTLTIIFPHLTDELLTLAAASNTLTALDGLYVSLFLALPLTEWLYRKLYYIKYRVRPEKNHLFVKEDKEGEKATKTSIVSEIKKAIPFLAVAAVLVLIANYVGYHNNIISSIPGILIILFTVLCGIVISKILPINIPAIAFMIIVGCILSYPGFPWGKYIIPYVQKISFLSLTTPILVYIGISFGKDFENFKRTGWRFIIVSLFVFAGAYLGAATVSQIVLKLTGQI